MDDLEAYRKRNENNIVLSPELPNANIAERYYQVNAITLSLETLVPPFHKMRIQGMFQGSLMNDLLVIIDDKIEL